MCMRTCQVPVEFVFHCIVAPRAHWLCLHTGIGFDITCRCRVTVFSRSTALQRACGVSCQAKILIVPKLVGKIGHGGHTGI